LATAVLWHPLAGRQKSVVQAFPSSQVGVDPAVQVPAWQVSAPLQASPSLHELPFGAVACWQPDTGSQVSVVHGFESSQLGTLPAVQPPAWQVSAPLQALPSLHELPFGALACWQPAPGLQVSVVHGFESSQFGAVPGVQAPAWQVSAPLQVLPSVHEVPSVTLACWQPVAGAQVSVVHGFESSQFGAVPAVQAPAWQVSAPLQVLPSVHEVPSVTLACWQPVAGAQVSLVHGFESSQLGAVPAVQAPAWQVSAPLQVSPSLHEVPSVTLACWQPVAGAQVSVVHGLASLQSSGVPEVHVPAWQVSPPLQALPSPHAVPLGRVGF
jgi:hypothetical protein